jgi:hypothetical protein
MKMNKEKSDANKTNHWVWFGVVCAVVAIMDDKGVVRRKVEQKRQIHEEAKRNALVSEGESNWTPFVRVEPFEVEVASRVERAAGSRGGQYVVIDSKSGAGTRSPQNGKNQVVVETSKSSIEPPDLEVLTEDISEADAAKIEARVKALNAVSHKIEANVNALNADKMQELEKKLSEAGEKIRDAAERVGAKISQRSRNTIVSRVIGDNSVPPVPPVPPLPPLVPGLSGLDTKNSPEAQKFQVRSGPCATREKSIAEARTNLEKIVASRLTQYGLVDSEFVRKAVDSLRPKFEVEESFREVGGDRYPLYVASVNVDLGTNFERQALRLVNQQTAHQRFAGLMGLSFGVVALLVGIDRMFLGRSGKPAGSEKCLV